MACGRYSKILWAILLTALWSTGYKALAQRSHFHNLNIDDGLIQSQPTCLAQDTYGNLWIGTYGGLSRYDGRTFTNYTTRNGLLSNLIRALAVDNKGNVWVSSPEGLSRFDGTTFQHFQQAEVVQRGLTVTQQIQVVRDTVWWRMQGDLFFIAGGKKYYYATPAGATEVSAIFVSDSDFWVGSRGVLYHRQGSKWDTLLLQQADSLTAPHFNRIYKGNNGTLWLTANNGLYLVHGHAIIPWSASPVPLSGITSIVQDNDNALWLGTNTGVIRIRGNNAQYYNKKNGLTDNEISDFLKDNEGNIWMASDGQGIFRFSGTQFAGLDESVGLASAQVMAIAAGANDTLYLGTYDAGLYTYTNGHIGTISFPSNPVPAITSLCYTRGGRLWIGTRGRGLWSYDNGVFHQYVAPDRDFPSNSVHSLYIDTFDRLWIGFSNGVMVLEEDMFKTAAVNTRPVYSFLTIGNDSTLISTEGGLMLFHSGLMMDFHTNTVIDSYSIQCFLLQKGIVWMGSNDNGIMGYNLKTGKVTVINKSDGLRSDFIYNIIADNDKNLWVGTGFGIHKIVLDTNGDYKISFYGKDQGVTGMESNINSVLKLRDGTIWFGTTNGVFHYDPNSLVVQPQPTHVMMQQVKIAGEPMTDPAWYDSLDKWYNVPYNLRLPYKRNSLSFTFQAITLGGAEQVLYRYRMDGLEAPWSDWSSSNSVTYSALPPGQYTLHVQCRTDEGKTVPELTYHFEIVAPFFKTTWFRFAVLGFCILLGITIQYTVTKRKEAREKLLARLRAEEQGKIRLRTAEDFHDEIGNKLTRINVLTNVLKSKITLNPESERIIQQIQENTGQLYGGTRDILWSLKPSNDELYEILMRIRDFGAELFQDTDISFTFTGLDEGYRKIKLDMNKSRNLIMIFKEALNNVLKYAHAQNVTIEVSIKHKNVFHIVLRDDGAGFDMHSAKKGNGLANMATRAGRLDGKLYIDSRQGKGTIITLSFKIPLKR